jgi:hypothetical protein
VTVRQKGGDASCDYARPPSRAPLMGSANDGCKEKMTLEMAYVMSWLYAPRKNTVHWCVWSAFAAIRPRPTLKAMDPYEIETKGGGLLLAICLRLVPRSIEEIVEPHVKTAV